MLCGSLEIPDCVFSIHCEIEVGTIIFSSFLSSLNTVAHIRISPSLLSVCGVYPAALIVKDQSVFIEQLLSHEWYTVLQQRAATC